jgi:hypothetical protein
MAIDAGYGPGRNQYKKNDGANAHNLGTAA